MKRKLFAASVAIALVGMAACSSDDSGSKGTTAPTTAPASANSTTETSAPAAPLRVAFFSAGEATSYLALANDTAQKVADENGVSLEIILANFDAQAQFNQIETAITSGDYDAFLVQALDPALVCDILTKDAPEAGIVVGIVNQPICDNSQKSGDEVVAPGTVNAVVTQSRQTYFDWVAQVVKENPDGAEVAAVLGPSNLTPIAVSFLDALKDASDNDPNFKVVAEVNTDYSAAQAAAAAEDLIQAHPNLTVIMSGYSPMSKAIVDVVKAAGKEGQIKIYDLGGDTWAIGAVKSGEIAGTIFLSPISETTLALQGLIDAARGNDYTKYVDLSRDPDLPGGSAVVTPDNVDGFTPEY